MTLHFTVHLRQASCETASLQPVSHLSHDEADAKPRSNARRRQPLLNDEQRRPDGDRAP